MVTSLKPRHVAAKVKFTPLGSVIDDMEWTDWGVLCIAAFLGGAVNSVAGGGTLLTFPALTIVLGTADAAAVVANATSTVSLFPGSLAAFWGYRREISGMWPWIKSLLLPSLIGGAIGTWLVVLRSPGEFKMLVPWLILTATCLFLLQPVISKFTGIGKPHVAPTQTAKWGIVAFQFCVAVYGGYFGAGIGILMLSALALMGISDMHRMNGVKTLLASAINGVSVGIFTCYGIVNWHLAIPMVVSSIIGGYIGASVARRLNKNLIRYTVIAIGLCLSGYYFLREYAGSNNVSHVSSEEAVGDSLLNSVDPRSHPDSGAIR